jgi:NAD(P)-dependent dehydrogenase (short-subunit alcohol dehydrogenase family)
LYLSLTSFVVLDRSNIDFFFGVPSGAGGIGLMFSTAFVKNGAKVYITSRKADECEKVAQQLTQQGPGTCFALAEDLSKMTGIKSFVKRLKEKESKVDVLINNSGVAWGEPMSTFPEQGWDKIFALNVKTVFYMTRELLPLLEKAATKEKPASVINIGSIAGITGQAVPTYSYDARYDILCSSPQFSSMF